MTRREKTDIPTLLSADILALRLHLLLHFADPLLWNVGDVGFVLQNSKNGLQRFFRENGSQATITDDVFSSALPKLPASSSLIAVVPHAIIRSPRRQPGKFVFGDPKKSFATLSARSGHSITAHYCESRVLRAARGPAQPRKITHPNRSGRNARRSGQSFRLSMRLTTMRLVTPAKVMPRCPWPKAWIRFG